MNKSYPQYASKTFFPNKDNDRIVLLKNASTFRMTYDNKASIPKFVKRSKRFEDSLYKYKKTEDSPKTKRVKSEIKAKFSTFTIGVKDIRIVERFERDKSPDTSRLY